MQVDEAIVVMQTIKDNDVTVTDELAHYIMDSLRNSIDANEARWLADHLYCLKKVSNLLYEFLAEQGW